MNFTALFERSFRVCPCNSQSSGFGRMFHVKNNPSELLEKALKLPAAARAALAGSLIESLDETVDEDAS
jgi:hypothetical protein